MAQKEHITLSIPGEVYERIKKHPEVKWSQAARQGILDKLGEVEGIMRGEDFFNSLPAGTRAGIDGVAAKKGWGEYHKKARAKEWKRTKSLTRTSS